MKNNQNGFVGVIVVVILAFIALGVIATATNIITIPWLKLNSQVQMERDINQQVYNAENALYNYHWFSEKKASIETADQNEQAVCSEYESYKKSRGNSFSEIEEESRLRSVCTGTKTYYNGLVNEYNARAGQVDRNIFKDGLPLFFSLKPF